MDSVEMLLLFDYYGELLTERQRQCIDLRYNQDMSLGEIAEELGVSRQGVYDNITRAEARMIKMEEKTGLVQRSQRSRKTAQAIRDILAELDGHPDPVVSKAVSQIAAAVESIEE